MALSASNLTAGGHASSYVTASISPASNALILATIVVETGTSTNPGNPSLSGNGLTWVLINTAGGGSILYDSTSGSRRKVFIFRAMGASPSSGAITITPNETSTGVLWVIDQITGTDTSGTNGSGAVVQSAVGKDETGSVNKKTVTLGAFGSTNNGTYGGSGWATGNLTFTAGTGFTKLNSFGLTTPGIDVATEFAPDNRTSVDETASANDFVGQIGLEIKAGIINTTVNAGISNATFSAQAPTVTTTKSVTVSPSVQSVVATTQGINVRVGDGASPSVQSAVFSAISPTITATQNVITSPAVQSAILSSISPTVTATSDKTVSPSVQSAVFSTQNPTVNTTSSVIVSPSVQSLVASQQSIGVFVGDSASPAVQSAVFSAISPTVTTTQNITTNQGVQSAIFSAISPTVTAQTNVVVSPVVQSAIFSQIDPTVTAEATNDVTVLPGVISLVASQQSIGVFLGDGATPSVQSATFSQPTPTVTIIRNCTWNAPVINLGYPQFIYDEKINFYKHLSGRLYLKL